MKVVYDNIIYSLQHSGGISVVWTNLVSRMLKSHHDIEFIEYVGAGDNISRSTISLPEGKVNRRSSFLMGLRRYINPTVQKDNRFVFHSSYFRICNKRAAINVTTVHDFTYELFVKNPLKRYVHCRQKHAAIRNSQCVVCISENTKKDLMRFLPDVPASRIHVIYNGVDDVFRVLDGKCNEGYVLFVGNRDGYKNFDKIVEPVSRMGMELRIVGRTLSKQEEDNLKSHSCHYRYEGFVDDERLNKLYNNACCLMYPSEYEGFGLPVIEAQKAGCPVIAYNASSIPEIIGDKTLLLDDLSADSICEKLKLLAEPSLREQIIAHGIENAKRFSWDAMADAYSNLYDSLCRG